MSLNIVSLDRNEQFLQFLNPDLCEIEESIEYGGLRTIHFTYEFQDVNEDKRLFIPGNKLWIQGDTNLSNCLYVINTDVEQDVYQKNTFSFDAEEVLVELNYAPLFSQTELVSQSCFDTYTVNGKMEVKVDWNALNYWFGSYFNIGVVQECISDYASRITLTGTMTLMSLLRHIEEETGNVFVTRYEKSQLNNIIHRYLDFLNPINVDKDWMLNLEYDFLDNATLAVCYDTEDNPTSEDKASQVTPFDDGETSEDYYVKEDGTDSNGDIWEYKKGTELPYTWIKEDEETEELYVTNYTPLKNMSLENVIFRITNDEGDVLDIHGEANGDDELLQWSSDEIGFSDDVDSVVIRLVKKGSSVGVDIQDTSFAISNEYGVKNQGYLDDLDSLPGISYESIIPDNSYFEIYDENLEYAIFRTQINNKIGKVHEEILDFGYNLENITFISDETETYSAVSPVLTAGNDTSGLSRTQMDKLINDWRNLQVNKGNIIPMIVQKVSITGDNDHPCTKRTGTATAPAKSAEQILGAYKLSTNYWTRPYKPNDNTEGDNKSYEYFRAIAYWKAPYTKNAGDLHISTDATQQQKYFEIMHRPDTRDERGAMHTPKMGVTESSDENVYSIYNQVALYLKEHEVPNVDVDVEVANLRDGEFNQYDIHDKVYIKMPDSQEIVTARVVKTSKEAHDIAKNTVSLSNYKSLKTVKTVTKETYIQADNTSFKYPNKKTLTATLCNADHNPEDSHSTEHPSNKLITFSLYKVDNGSSTFTGKVYTKKTLAYGKASIILDYDPGDYELEIRFAGDEEYSECSITININVSGTKEVVAQMSAKNNTSKKSSSSKTKYKTVKTYYTKCGVSPDKNTIVAVAKPSASVSDAKKKGVSMKQLYRTVFKNKCPECGKSKLRFDGGKSNKCISSAGAHGRGYKTGVPEHEITCVACDSDFDGVTGLEKNYGHSTRLTVVKKPVKSSQSEFAKLTKGQLVYGTKKVKVSSKNNVNSKTRVTKGKVSAAVKQKAKSIVGNKTGLNAAKAIASWMDKHIAYAGYANFKRSPKTVLKKKSANCCDGTRLFFELCDAAGLTQYFKFQYVHVPGHVYGKVTTKKSGKYRWVDHASDYHKAWGYICRNYRSSNRSYSTYPKLPF